jgi:hypothetical protein
MVKRRPRFLSRLNLRRRFAAVIRAGGGKWSFHLICCHVGQLVTHAMGVAGEAFHVRPLGHCVATDGHTRHQTEGQHAEHGPGARRWRKLRQCRELPERGVVPLLRPGPDVHYDEAGLVPFGAVMILIRTTTPQPITA